MKRLLAILLVGVGINGFALQIDGELIHIAPREAVEGNTLTLDAIYTGDLDDGRYFNRALSATEVLALYNKGRS